ncbi:hypothetical protein AK812_SmicGene35898 [Symbiodinium microadriaticum]|uniref:Uncharacterized protein n=1 Tax=Symbiodinium microadriaticum TaxID=2951 RepID=A0A1Q9CKC0_SYMMI|nr:hypothetical protein AK812_SmicGene35898 [Symbiodinium microadriaticum]
MAKPFTWDFEPRSVAFKLQLQASFHPSVGGCSVSLPFLGANGDLAAPVAVSLSSGETKQRQAGPGGRSAQTASVEKDLGSFNVTFEFVKGIQQAKLPISVALEGGREIASQARICLGPLLLTGSKALSPELYNPGEPPRSKRLRPRNAVAATFTDSLGVAGLYSLDVLVLMDKPLLSQEMLQRLMPACFRVEMIRGLPNEQWLPQHCEDAWDDVSVLSLCCRKGGCHFPNIVAQRGKAFFRDSRDPGKPAARLANGHERLNEKIV